MRRGETRAELGARNRRLARGQVGDLRAVERAIEREAQSLDRPRDELELEAIAFGAADVGRELDRIRHAVRSEEHTSELQSLMRISYAVFCLKKKKTNAKTRHRDTQTRKQSENIIHQTYNTA